jgi:exosortase/archaeosortase family protein
LNTIGIAARHEGNILFTARGSLGIDEACSGLRSLQASLVSGVFLGLLLLRGWFHRLFILVASVALVLVANLMRTTFLAWQMHRLGEAGVKNLHDPAGASLLLVNMIGMALLGFWLVQREKRFPPPPTSPPPPMNLAWTLNREAVWPLACSALFLVTATIPSVRRQWQSPAEGVLLGLRPQPVHGFRTAPLSTELWAKVLRFDTAEDRDFVSNDGSELGVFHATWVAGKVSNQFVGQHLPAICFQNAGWSATGPAFVRPLDLHGLAYPVLWQGFRHGPESVMTGYLHLVGGQPRVFHPGEAGLFSWRTLVWDIRRGKPADQEVFIFTVGGKNRLEHAWQDMTDLLRQRYP